MTFLVNCFQQRSNKEKDMKKIKRCAESSCQIELPISSFALLPGFRRDPLCQTCRKKKNKARPSQKKGYSTLEYGVKRISGITDLHPHSKAFKDKERQKINENIFKDLGL